MIVYWQGIAGHADLIEKYGSILEKLTTGAYQSADFDLKRSKKNGCKFYTVKVNHSDRILCTIVTIQGKEYLFLIEEILNHDYQKSKYLNNPNLWKIFFDHNLNQWEQITEQDFEAVDTNETLPIHQDTSVYPVNYFNGEFISLTTDQYQAVQIQDAALITGVPGAGKSCVGLCTMVQAVEQQRNPDEAILYVCESTDLLKNIRHNWQQMPISREPYAQQAVFMTYADLFRNQLPNHTVVESSCIKKWISDAVNNHKKTWQVISAKKELIYFEFCLISGFIEQEYYQLPADKSYFSSEEERKLIWKIFQNCQAYLNDAKQVHWPFYQGKVEKKYALIVADECQDFSTAQVKLLLESTSNNRILLCGDSNQALNGYKTPFSLLEDMLFKRLGNKPVQRVYLTQSFRCSKAVTAVGNTLLKLGNLATGGKQEKNGYIQVETKNDKPGYVSWKTITNADSLKAQASADCFIITREDLLAEAEEKFDTALVFTVKKIKGLEGRKIILYRLFESDLTEINQQLAKLDLDAAAKDSRPKPGQDHFNLGGPIKHLYTAVTRAQEEIEIYEYSIEKNNFVAQHVKKSIDEINKNTKGKNPEAPLKNKIIDWLNVAKSLVEQGLNEQACGVFIKHLNKTEADFNQFLERINNQKLQVLSKPDIKSEIIQPTATKTEQLFIGNIKQLIKDKNKLFDEFLDSKNFTVQFFDKTDKEQSVFDELIAIPNIYKDMISYIKASPKRLKIDTEWLLTPHDYELPILQLLEEKTIDFFLLIFDNDTNIKKFHFRWFSENADWRLDVLSSKLPQLLTIKAFEQFIIKLNQINPAAWKDCLEKPLFKTHINLNKLHNAHFFVQYLLTPIGRDIIKCILMQNPSLSSTIIQSLTNSYCERNINHPEGLTRNGFRYAIKDFSLLEQLCKILPFIVEQQQMAKTIFALQDGIYSNIQVIPRSKLANIEYLAAVKKSLAMTLISSKQGRVILLAMMRNWPYFTATITSHMIFEVARNKAKDPFNLLSFLDIALLYNDCFSYEFISLILKENIHFFNDFEWKKLLKPLKETKVPRLYFFASQPQHLLLLALLMRSNPTLQQLIAQYSKKTQLPRVQKLIDFNDVLACYNLNLSDLGEVSLSQIEEKTENQPILSSLRHIQKQILLSLHASKNEINTSQKKSTSLPVRSKGKVKNRAIAVAPSVPFSHIKSANFETLFEKKFNKNICYISYLFEINEEKFKQFMSHLYREKITIKDKNFLFKPMLKADNIGISPLAILFSHRRGILILTTLLENDASLFKYFNFETLKNVYEEQYKALNWPLHRLLDDIYGLNLLILLANHYPTTYEKFPVNLLFESDAAHAPLFSETLHMKCSAFITSILTYCNPQLQTYMQIHTKEILTTQAQHFNQPLKFEPSRVNSFLSHNRWFFQQIMRATANHDEQHDSNSALSVNPEDKAEIFGAETTLFP